jgi:hypothetical protein
MREMNNEYRNLVAKAEGKRPLGRNGCRWEDSIIMGLEARNKE